MAFYETSIVLEALENLRDDCHKNSVDHGFWDEGERYEYTDDQGVQQRSGKTKPWNFGEKIALIHSELSEMFEAWRKGVGDKPCDKDINVVDPKSPEFKDSASARGTRRLTAIEEEVADVFIRMFDLCGKLQIDVGRVILAKMDYNKGRPMMHGRKC